MFLLYQPKRKVRDISIRRVKMGGYSMFCHIVADDKIDLRPKARKRRSGLVLTKASTIPLLRPAGDIAGAKAMKRLILSLRSGCMANVAKA